MPVDGPEITKLDVQEVVALKGDVARGQMNIARCYMCHQVNGTGVDFGPALDQWGLGRSVEAIATAIIHPNEGIAHGFEGTEYVTKDGHTLQGFTLFAGGSVILKVMGGGEVSFSRNLVESSEPLEKSLMMSAGQLGLTNQDVADIAAYLKAGAPVDPKAVPVSTTAPPAAKEVKPKAKPQAQPLATNHSRQKRNKAALTVTDPLINPFANPSDDPALPRVLIIGDSISIGYTTMLRKNLVGKANVHRVDGNCRWSAYGDENIEQWLGEGDWDLIHFNFGLWDWYGWSQDDKIHPRVLCQEFGEHRHQAQEDGRQTGSSPPPLRRASARSGRSRLSSPRTAPGSSMMPPWPSCANTGSPSTTSTPPSATSGKNTNAAKTTSTTPRKAASCSPARLPR